MKENEQLGQTEDRLQELIILHIHSQQEGPELGDVECCTTAHVLASIC